jgi:hypothetical protein
MLVDETTARILDRYLSDSDWYPEDDEYRGPNDLKVDPDTLWKVLHLYAAQQFDELMGKPVDPEARVTALEALTCDRVLMETLHAQRQWLVYDVRKGGDSWAEVGKALGVSRQSAHEMYAQDLRERAEWWKGRVGAQRFAEYLPEYESVLRDK